MPNGAAQPFPRMSCVNRTHLSKLEEGASYPGLEIIAKLAHYAFWVDLARSATAAVPEKANAPTV